MRPPAPCGTLGGYWWHIHHNHPACVPCADAYNQAREDKRLAPQRRAVLAEAVGHGSYGGIAGGS